MGPWLLPQVSVCEPPPGRKDSLPSHVSLSLFLEHATTHAASLPVYTDGSKTDVGVGFGVVFPSFCRGGSLPAAASIFTAELTAIIVAVKIIFTLSQPGFTIFTDSFSALLALKSFNSTHPLVLSILEWLLLIKHRGRSVDIC